MFSKHKTTVSVDCSTHMKLCFFRKTQSVKVVPVLFNGRKRMTLTKTKITGTVKTLNNLAHDLMSVFILKCVLFRFHLRPDTCMYIVQDFS